MKEVKLEGDLGSILRQLYEYRMKGEHVYCVYEGIRFESDSITRDAIVHVSPELSEKEFMKLDRDERDAYYKKLIEYDRLVNGVRPITDSLIIEGIKFICENRNLSHNELTLALLKMGCNFNFEDISKLPNNNPNKLLFAGIANGDICCGANVIANVISSDFGRAYAEDAFLQNDGDTSLYNYVRVTTGDKSYTKELIDLKTPKLHPGMTDRAIAETMAEGNPGAASFACDLFHMKGGKEILEQCDQLGIRGVRLYMLFNDCCGRNIDKFYRTMLVLTDGVLSFEDIHKNLGLGRALPFINDELVIDEVPPYGEEFGPGDPKWIDFCIAQRDLLMSELDKILDDDEKTI